MDKPKEDTKNAKKRYATLKSQRRSHFPTLLFLSKIRLIQVTRLNGSEKRRKKIQFIVSFPKVSKKVGDAFYFHYYLHTISKGKQREEEPSPLLSLLIFTCIISPLLLQSVFKRNAINQNALHYISQWKTHLKLSSPILNVITNKWDKQIYLSPLFPLPSD